MVTYFISDLHLSESRPDIIRDFLEFIEGKAINADALYILGDLFEFWIGDDDLTPVARQVAEALASLAEHGVPCYYIHGNRDFMIGADYARRCRMILLDEEEVVELYGQRVLILHGDTLCTDDEGYQKYRRITQLGWLRKVFLFMPLMIRQMIANKIRGNSKSAKTQKSLSIMDVNQSAVEQRFVQRQTHYMIHGHTHRPAIHHHNYPALGDCHRIVLGDWYSQASILRVGPSSLYLEAQGEIHKLDLAQAN